MFTEWLNRGTHPDMALIRCPHSLLWVYTKRTFSLLRRNRASSRSFVHTCYMTREPTHFEEKRTQFRLTTTKFTGHSLIASMVLARRKLIIYFILNNRFITRAKDPVACQSEIHWEVINVFISIIIILLVIKLRSKWIKDRTNTNPSLVNNMANLNL